MGRFKVTYCTTESLMEAAGGSSNSVKDDPESCSKRMAYIATEHPKSPARRIS